MNRGNGGGHALKIQDRNTRMETDFFNCGAGSHMPFVAHDRSQHFAPHQFCCRMIGGKWKLCHCDTDGEWRQIQTGLPADATECSPTAEWEDGMWKISFIAGGAETSIRFRLYRLFGLTSGAAMTICNADVGYLQKRRIVHAGRRGSLFIQDPNRIREIHFADVEYLYRVSYNPNNPDELLVSGQKFGGDIFSWIYVPGRTLESLTSNGNPAYKAAFFNGRLFYAMQTGAEFEDRTIVEAQDFRREPLDFSAIVTESSSPNKSGITGEDEEFE